MRKTILFLAIILSFVAIIDAAEGAYSLCKRGLYDSWLPGSSTACSEFTSESACTSKRESSGSGSFSCVWKTILSDSWADRSNDGYEEYDWNECYYDTDCRKSYICFNDADCASGICVSDKNLRYGVCERPWVNYDTPDSRYINDPFLARATHSIQYPQYCGIKGLLEFTARMKTVSYARAFVFDVNGEDYYAAVSNYDVFASSWPDAPVSYTGYGYANCEANSVVGAVDTLAYCSAADIFDFDNLIPEVPRGTRLDNCELMSQDTVEELCPATELGDTCYAQRYGINVVNDEPRLNCNSKIVEDCSDTYCQTGESCSEGCVLKDDFPSQGAFLKTVPSGESLFYEGYNNYVWKNDRAFTDKNKDSLTDKYYTFYWDGDNDNDIAQEKNRNMKTYFPGAKDYCVYSSQCEYKNGWTVQYTNNLNENGDVNCICNDGRCFSGVPSYELSPYCADPVFSAPQGIAYDLSDRATACVGANNGWQGLRADAVIKSVKFSDDEGNFCKIDNCRKKKRSESSTDNYISFSEMADYDSNYGRDYTIYDVGVDVFYVENIGSSGRGEGGYKYINERDVVDNSFFKRVYSTQDNLKKATQAMRGEDKYLALSSAKWTRVSYLTNCPPGMDYDYLGRCGASLTEYEDNYYANKINSWIILDLGAVKNLESISFDLALSNFGTVHSGNDKFRVFTATNDVESWTEEFSILRDNYDSQEDIADIGPIDDKTISLGKPVRFILFANEGGGGSTLIDDVWIRDFKYVESDYDARNHQVANEMLCEFLDTDASIDDGIDADGYAYNDCPVYDSKDKVRMGIEIKNTGEVNLEEPGVVVWFGEEPPTSYLTEDCGVGSTNPWCYFGDEESHNSNYMINTGNAAVYWFPSFEGGIGSKNFMPNYQCDKVYESKKWDDKLSVGETIKLSCWFDKEVYDLAANGNGYHIYLVDGKYDVGADRKPPIRTGSTANPFKQIIVSDRFAEIHSLFNNKDNRMIERISGNSRTYKYPNLKPYWNEKKIQNVGFKYKDMKTVYSALENFTPLDSCWIFDGNSYVCEDSREKGNLTAVVPLTKGNTYELTWEGNGAGTIWISENSKYKNYQKYDIYGPSSINSPIIFQAPADSTMIIFEDNSLSSEGAIESMNIKYQWVNMQGNVNNVYTHLDEKKIESRDPSARGNIQNAYPGYCRGDTLACSSYNDESSCISSSNCEWVVCEDCFACSFMDTSDKFVHNWIYKNKPVNSGGLSNYNEFPENWYYAKSAALVYVDQPIHKTGGHTPDKLFMELEAGDYFVTDMKVYGIEQRGDELVYGKNYIPDIETATGDERIYYANNSEVSGSSLNCDSRVASGTGIQKVCSFAGPPYSYSCLDSQTCNLDTNALAEGEVRVYKIDNINCESSKTCADTIFFENLQSGKKYNIEWFGGIKADTELPYRQAYMKIGDVTIMNFTKRADISDTGEDYTTGHPFVKYYTVPLDNADLNTGRLEVEYYSEGYSFNFSRLKLTELQPEAVSFRLEGVQPDEDNFNKGWYVVEFTTVSDDRDSLPSIGGSFRYNDDFDYYGLQSCKGEYDSCSGQNPEWFYFVDSDFPFGCGRNYYETYEVDISPQDPLYFEENSCINFDTNDGTYTACCEYFDTIEDMEFKSKPASQQSSLVVDIVSNQKNTGGALQSFDKFNVELRLPDVYEGYDIGCFASDRYTSSFTDIFYRAFIYRLKFKTFYNMLVEEFSDYTVPIKIKEKNEPDSNWDQITGRLEAINSIGTIKETNPDLTDTTGCISKTVLNMADAPNKIKFTTTSVSEGGEYSFRLLDSSGAECFASRNYDSAKQDELVSGGICDTTSTIEICVSGDQAELGIDYVELLKGNTQLFIDNFEGKTVVDRVVGENCPNNYCDWSLGETAATCSDCYGVCESNGYKSATYECPANIPVSAQTPGCYEVGTTIGDSCQTDCHCAEQISYSGGQDYGVCNSRGKCAPFRYSEDILNEVIPNCYGYNEIIPRNLNCADYGRKYKQDGRTYYECLDSSYTPVAICNVAS